MGGGRPVRLPCLRGGRLNSTTKLGVLAEVTILWIVTLLLIRLVVFVVEGRGAWEVVLALVPVLFMYAPVLLCRIRGVDSYAYPLALPAFRDRDAWLTPLKLNAVVIGVILVPWLIGYHVYQTTPFDLEWLGMRVVKPAFSWQGTLPESILKLVGYHVFFVAIPEEFFYRGYLQSRLDEVFPTRWRVLGASLGPGILITSVLFASGHSIVNPAWWHFAIFAPSLVFGWMRARTGDIVAGAMFHAWANITVGTLDALYGVTI